MRDHEVGQYCYYIHNYSLGDMTVWANQIMQLIVNYMTANCTIFV